MLKTTQDPDQHDKQLASAPNLLFSSIISETTPSPSKDLSNEQDEIVVFSCDYDNCADILFLDELGFKSRTQDQKAHTKAQSDFFRAHLIELSSNKLTELYIGSSRQDLHIDSRGKEQNKNGACFINFFMLAQQLQWTFHPLLLPDIYFIKGQQYSINKGQSMNCKEHRLQSAHLPMLHPDDSLNIKLNILKAQLEDITRNHPDKKISFYFFDDDPDFDCKDLSIFYAFKTYIEANPSFVPANIKLSLMRFDHAERINEAMLGETPDPDLLFWTTEKSSSSKEVKLCYSS